MMNIYHREAYMRWIESPNRDAESKAAQAAQKAAAERDRAEALAPIERKRKIAEEFLTQFLPIIGQLQRKLHREGYDRILGSRDGLPYGGHSFCYAWMGNIGAFENRSTVGNEGSSRTESYCMRIYLGELGALLLVPTGQDEHNLGLLCHMQIYGAPDESIHISNRQDTHVFLATVLWSLVDKSTEAFEQRSRRSRRKRKWWSIFE